MKKLFLLMIPLFFQQCTFAEDLGAVGQTYKTDPDAREIFKSVVRKKEQSGELRKFWKEYRDKTIESIKNPPPLGIPSSFAYRTFSITPKFTFPSDIKDPNGNVVVKKGTVVEPLKQQPLSNGLIFIDGLDQAQIDYAIARGRSEYLKIVLVAGSPLLLRTKYKNADWKGGKGIPFYFDQRKLIISSLKKYYGVEINSVPATMTQVGDRLSFDFGWQKK